MKYRDYNEVYEEHADKLLMERKLIADSHKKGNEHQAHFNIVAQEHKKHEKRVEKLCLNELSHIEQIYQKQMTNLIRQQVDMNAPEFERMKTQIESQKSRMVHDVVSHGLLLKKKFLDQEHKHSNLFSEIEKQDDVGRQDVNYMTNNYNADKKQSYTEKFLFGVKLADPMANMCLTGDCSTTHNADYKFLERTAKGRPLLHNYRHPRA